MPRTSKVAQHSRTPGAPPQKSLTIAVGSGLVDLNGYEGIDGAWAGVTIPCVLFVPGYHVQGIKDSLSSCGEKQSRMIKRRRNIFRPQ